MGKSLRDLEKEKYWRRTIGKWKQSGQQIEAYCREHGIKSGSFHWWKRELDKRDREKQSTKSFGTADQPCMIPEFSEVKVVQRTPEATFDEAAYPTGYSGLEVVLCGNRRIRVYRGFDASSLYRLVQVLEYPSC